MSADGFQVAILRFAPADETRLLERLRELFAQHAPERLLACFHTILGERGKIVVIRRADGDDPAENRRDMLEARGYWGLGGLVRSVEVDSYATMPFLPDVASGSLGPLFEIRSYELASQDGVRLTAEAWAPLVKLRLGFSPVAAVMHSVTGAAPRLLHIYPYRSLAERAQIRAQAIATGLWPPHGSIDRNLRMRNDIARAADFSPLS